MRSVLRRCRPPGRDGDAVLAQRGSTCVYVQLRLDRLRPSRLRRRIEEGARLAGRRCGPWGRTTKASARSRTPALRFSSRCALSTVHLDKPHPGPTASRATVRCAGRCSAWVIVVVGCSRCALFGVSKTPLATGSCAVQVSSRGKVASRPGMSSEKDIRKQRDMVRPRTRAAPHMPGIPGRLRLAASGSACWDLLLATAHCFYGAHTSSPSAHTSPYTARPRRDVRSHATRPF